MEEKDGREGWKKRMDGWMDGLNRLGNCLIVYV